MISWILLFSLTIFGIILIKVSIFFSFDILPKNISLNESFFMLKDFSKLFVSASGISFLNFSRFIPVGTT